MTQKKSQVDCLLIHVGVPSIARGLYAIYYFLNNHNINTKLMIFDEENSDILFEQINSLQGIKMIGFSVHWHPQIVSSIKIAELIKCFENFKETKIVFGGLTASVFKEDLINISFIDFVIYGDGILPIKLLYDHISNCGDNDSLKNIPNLIFKNNNHICINDIIYIADDETLTKLELQAIEDGHLLKSSRNVMAVGSGCSKNCNYCGGSNFSYKKFIGRSSTVIRKVSNIHQILYKAINKGIKFLYFAADYDGKCKIISEYLAPFDLSNFNYLILGAWGIPNIDNIHSMFQNTTFPNKLNFKIEISPETGCDKARKSLGGNYFSNRDLVLFIETYFRYYPNYKLDIFFSYFLPGCDYFNRKEREFIIELYKQFPKYVLSNKLKIYFLPLSTDPGSILQTTKMKGFSVEVNSLNEYVNQMLRYKSNVGNFLKHFPDEYGKEDVEFLKNMYFFENILREKYPKAFYGMLYLFDGFESYNQFIVSCVRKINEIISESEDNPFPIKNILGLDKFSLLGFHFSNDEVYSDTSILTLLWLNTIMNGLIDVKNDTKTAKIESLLKKTNLDLLNYVIEYLLLKLCLKKNKVVAEFSKNSRIFNNIPKFNHFKVNNLRTVDVENCHIIPYFNQFCTLVETNHLSIKYSVLNPNENLLHLKRENFCRFLLNVKDEMISFEKKELLGINNLVSFRSNIPIYWEKVLNDPCNEINIILTELIVLANIPVEILLPKINGDLSQVHISNFFGVFSDICSIEMVNFFIHFLLNSKNIYHYKPVNPNQTTYILMTPTGKSIDGYFSQWESELCKLCTQTRTLSNIYASLQLKGDLLEKNAFIDMVIHLYNVGILI